MKSFVGQTEFVLVDFILVAISVSISFNKAHGGTQTIFTDADTYGVIVCRNDAPFSFWCDRAPGREQVIKVHDQNALMAGYWHFDLNEIDAATSFQEARLQLDTVTNSYDETTVSVFAIADPESDWDLDEISERRLNGINAPFSDYESFAWTGAVPPQQRFNDPTPFLEEGTAPESRVRLLQEGIIHENQDLNTVPEGNEFGGHLNGMMPGEPGSACCDDNPWPVRNAIDIDITDLIRWKLGQNASYSAFDPVDLDLTVMIRTDDPQAGDHNGFVRYASKESRLTRESFGDNRLQSARIVLLGTVDPSDINGDGTVDASDIDWLYANVGAETPAYDLDNDGTVDQSDVDILVAEKLNTFYGDANLDGEFNSGDFVQVFQEGKYEVDVDAGWAQGDWTGDKRFDSSDFVVAFQDGGFEMGPRVALNAVPEPSSVLLSVLGCLILCHCLHDSSNSRRK